VAHFELQYTTRNWGITLLPGNGLNPCLARPHMRPRIPLVDHRTRHGNRPPLVSASTVAPDAVDVGTESLFLECWACAATGTRHCAAQAQPRNRCSYRLSAAISRVVNSTRSLVMASSAPFGLYACIGASQPFLSPAPGADTTPHPARILPTDPPSCVSGGFTQTGARAAPPNAI